MTLVNRITEHESERAGHIASSLLLLLWFSNALHADCLDYVNSLLISRRLASQPPPLCLVDICNIAWLADIAGRQGSASLCTDSLLSFTPAMPAFPQVDLQYSRNTAQHSLVG